VGLFFLFDNKNRRRRATDKNSSRKRRTNDLVDIKNVGAASARQYADQRKARQATTVLKIDAIESEMSSEFVPPPRNLPPQASLLTQSAPKLAADKQHDHLDPEIDPPLAPLRMKAITNQREGLSLHHDTAVNHHVVIAGSEAGPMISEAAILFANNQIGPTERLLKSAIHDEIEKEAKVAAWNMLFDLYSITGKRTEFEDLSIDYANEFETSPPPWREIAPEKAPLSATVSIPAVIFPSNLDRNIIKQLEHVQNLAKHREILRLEFTQVAQVSPIGCGILLSVLKRLQKSGNDLILVGARELVDKIRAILKLGRRNETEAPWLLILEILRFLHLEKEFEETSMDYCLTFDISPPPFIPSINKVTTLSNDVTHPALANKHFVMPALIEGDPTSLVQAISTYASQHQPAILDCIHLNRIDFTTAGKLLTAMGSLIQQNTTIEFHNVNYLIAALFHTLGIKDIFRIVLRKN